VKVLVDIHVGVIAGFPPRNFKRMELYPGHLHDRAEVSYTVASEKVVVSLTVIPERRVVAVHLSGAAIILSHFPTRHFEIPYLAGPYPFPDVSGLRKPADLSMGQVESAIAAGTWHAQPSRTTLPEQATADGDDLVIMLGGEAWLNRTRETFSSLRDGNSNDGAGLDVLLAFGARESNDAVLGVDGGIGFFYQPGLMFPEYIGVFTMGHSSIGIAIEISAELTLGLYWGSADRTQTALEAFGSVNGFFRVSIGDVIAGSLDLVVAGSPHLRVCGVNFGAGVGAGFSAAFGVQGVGEVHVDSDRAGSVS
jgi:hypothetical protein